MQRGLLASFFTLSTLCLHNYAIYLQKIGQILQNPITRTVMTFSYANQPSTSPPPEPTADGVLTIQARAPSDIWRKPPNLDVCNAPIAYQSLPISTFKRARVTASGDWKTLYDQAGLVLIFPGKQIAGTPKRWVKTGIEFYNNRPCVSVVAADDWADWSLLPLSAADEAQGKTTVEVEREEEDGSWGSVLKVFLVDSERGRMPIREITWVFHDLDESEEMWVGMYAAKPTKDERDWLEVKLSNFELESRD